MLIDLAKVVHGAFNFLLALVFLYQAWMGLAIRRGRKKGSPRPPIIKRHRRLGPLLVILSAAGYCFGLALVLIDKGHALEYPLHFAVGSLIVLFVLGQFAVSKKIKGRESFFRTLHLLVGICIVCLYALQMVIGVGVLL
jgi:peptidoglycan/LPS O-acetylase OafA/YrhL